MVAHLQFGQPDRRSSQSVEGNHQGGERRKTHHGTAAHRSRKKHARSRTAIIDGEAVVHGNTGLPDFQALHRELGKSDMLLYDAFDLLYLDGYDLRDVAYVERKRLLQQLLVKAPETFVYVDYLEADGEQVFDHACKLGLGRRRQASRPALPLRTAGELDQAQMHKE
jgi:ATP dependent DNA ligase domain